MWYSVLVIFVFAIFFSGAKIGEILFKPESKTSTVCGCVWVLGCDTEISG